MANRKPIIVGHSHVRALGCPLETEDGVTAVAPVVRSWATGGVDERFACVVGQWPRDRSYYEELLKIAVNRTVFILWEGNQHLADFLFESAIPFDFMVSERPDLITDFETMLLPQATVTEYFRGDGPLDELLSRLKQTPGCRPILTGTPPPKKDDSFLREMMLAEKHWQTIAVLRKIELNDAKLSPPLLRYKLWLIIQSLMKEAAERNEVEFCPIPPDVQTQDGFLAESFYGIDATHAGGNYGEVFRDYLFKKYFAG